MSIFHELGSFIALMRSNVHIGWDQSQEENHVQS